jgi:hypothetical protein
VAGEDDGEVAVGGPKAPQLAELAAVGSSGDPVEEVAEEDGGEVAGGVPEAPQLGVGRQELRTRWRRRGGRRRGDRRRLGSGAFYSVGGVMGIENFVIIGLKQTRFAILTLAPHFIDADGPICHPHKLSK